MRHALLALLAVVMLTGHSGLADCPGDLNGDDSIDMEDLSILLAAWEIDDGGDVDGDGDTDISDLGALLAVYDTDCPPEPGDMVLIPGGQFAMGRHNGSGDNDELPVHDVYIDAFRMDVYETTNRRYAAYLNGAYPSQIKVVSGIVFGIADTGLDYPYCNTTASSQYSRIDWDGSTFTVTTAKRDHPMLEVSWYGAAAYANWRSSEESREPSYDLDSWTCDFDANGYRLPTEAEWEYAARGGEHTPYYTYPWGNTINGSHANYENSGDPWDNLPYPQTTQVGYYDGNHWPFIDMANGYGLYDMAGNVWEWCNDWYDADYYDSSPYDNPKGPGSGDFRVLRSGSWYNGEYYLRCANRIRYFPEYRKFSVGFRLALD
jgi:formylglycine-generating enzyme required for sulfatase activity